MGYGYRKNIPDAIYRRVGISRRDAQKRYEIFIDELMQRIERNGRISLRGLGTFRLLPTKGGTGTNPQTGERLPFRRTWTVKFWVANSWRHRVNLTKTLPDGPEPRKHRAGSAWNGAHDAAE